MNNYCSSLYEGRGITNITKKSWAVKGKNTKDGEEYNRR
jgi:hypothetical protein